MEERAVVLNGLAQGIRSLDRGVDWFESLAGTEQFEVLRDLTGFCIQARALPTAEPPTTGDGGALLFDLRAVELPVARLLIAVIAVPLLVVVSTALRSGDPAQALRRQGGE